MIIEFLPEANAELLDAVAYYEANCPDWANGPDIDRHITWIAGNPEAPGSATEVAAG
jgi:hypothetical protein